MQQGPACHRPLRAVCSPTMVSVTVLLLVFASLPVGLPSAMLLLLLRCCLLRAWLRAGLQCLRSVLLGDAGAAG